MNLNFNKQAMIIPPSDSNIEQALLGALLIDQTIVEKFFENGQVEWFHSSINRTVAETIFNMALEEKIIDIVSVGAELGPKLNLIGGQTFLFELTELSSSYGWETYSKKLEELYKRREILKQANGLLNLVEKGEDLESGVELAFLNINSVLSEGKVRTINLEEGIKDTINYIDENKNKSGELIGWSWGNDWLDQKTRGIKRGKTYRIGAPSGLGKTNLVYDLIVDLVEQKSKILFISLENSIETTLINISATVDRKNSISVEKGANGFNSEWFNKNKNYFHLTDQLFDIEDIKREVLKVKPDIVILDYIGLVNIKGTDEKTIYNRYADIVKQFVQKNKWLSWIDLSNLNKDDDEERIRGHKGFNGSAKLKNNTDFGLHMFYYKPFYEWKNQILKGENEELKKKIETVNCITFLISKQRGGTDGIEEQFTIDYNNGYNYNIMDKSLKEKVNGLI